MVASQAISIRIPQGLLEQLDSAAAQQYPLRGGNTPNRSRMILGLIQEGLERKSSSDVARDSHTATRNESQTMANDIEELIKQQVAQQVQLQLQIQQQVREQMEQISEIAELRQEVAQLRQEVEAGQSESQISLWPDRGVQLSESETTQSDVEPESVNQPVPEADWLTARQSFQALGGDPGDRNSSVSSIDGSKQIRFSTFKSKISSELKLFGLELSQDRKRRRQPCYRLLKPATIPSDEEILETIRDLDRQLRTDNYLPIFHLREKLQPPLSREELDRALYRLERNNLIELSSLQEVIAYTKEQIDAGIPQNIGGPLFFIIRE